MKFIRVIKCNLTDSSNWQSTPKLKIESKHRINGDEYNRYELSGYYKTSPLLKIPGSFNENRQWEDGKLGIWDKEKTDKYIELAKEKGIVEPIWISIDEDDVKIMEGNHRIKLAEYLKLDFVPIKVTFDSDSLPKENYFNLYDYINKYDSYIPR